MSNLYIILLLMIYFSSGCSFVATITDLNSKSTSAEGGQNSSASPSVEVTSSLIPANSSNYMSYAISGTCSLVANITVKADANSLGVASCSAGTTGTNGTWTLVLDLTLVSDGNINLQLYDASSNSLLKSYGFLKDIITPVLAGSITDGTYYNSLSTSPIFSWSAGSDIGGSGILKYQIALGSTSGGTQVLNWTDIGNITTYQVMGVSLLESATYFPSLRVVDLAGNTSSIINGDGWITDTQGPLAPGIVLDGEQIVSTSYSSWISWAATSDAGSGLASYEVRIVDASNNPVVAWLNVGNVLGYSLTGLSLTGGQTYKAEVRAIDNLGQAGALTQGDGWYVVPSGWKQQSYIKAPNANTNDMFGAVVALSGDTAVVGAYGEASTQTTITNGNTASSDNSSFSVGAVYVFKRTGTTWEQESYLKAPNAGSDDRFGYSVAVFGDTVAVGAFNEGSNQTTITNGTTASANNSALASGAVYVFKRTGTSWAQEAYIKPPNTGAGDRFGNSVAISGDTLVVGSYNEASNQTTITNGTTASADNSATNAGAAYVFKRTGVTWSQQAYLKPPNAGMFDCFGTSVSIAGDTIVVGANGESSNQTTITNGATASADNSMSGAGAAYVFKRTGTIWAQEAYLKAPNVNTGDSFGNSVSVAEDTIVVGASNEDSNQTIITNGTTASSDNSSSGAGAAYVFKRTGTIWAQEAYLKAPNADAGDNFGTSVYIFGDTIAVGAPNEDSNQTTITNDTTASSNNSISDSGAVYVFKRAGAIWVQESYLKAPNADAGDYFGWSLGGDNETLIVGAVIESSNQTTITNGASASSDNSASYAGAAYIFNVDRVASWSQQAYVKASNTEAGDAFGKAVGISGDTLVVGAHGESSNQTTITNGTSASSDNSSIMSGAAYVFKRTGTTWVQEAYLKAPNAEAFDMFGIHAAISGDTIVIGATNEDSNQITITNGATASSDNSRGESGAAYVFKRTGTTWVQEAYLKAPNAGSNDNFAYSISISRDTIVVGAPFEDSNQTTITNGTTASADNTASSSGAAYVFKRTGTTWAQEAYLKASNAEANDNFGDNVSISGDTIVVGAMTESSNQTTITNGTTASADNSASTSGAAYVFKRAGVNWVQEAYLKASNSESGDLFGSSVSISGDTIVVGANNEDSNQTSITNGTNASNDNSMTRRGAAYVFKRTGTAWVQEAYLKAPNSDSNDAFGNNVSISGNIIIIGVNEEDSNQTIITNGTMATSDNSAIQSGTVYVFKRTGTTWAQEAYLKAPNAEAGDNFGTSISISEETIVVGATGESSNQTTITNGATASSDNLASGSGAVYVFDR